MASRVSAGNDKEDSEHDLNSETTEVAPLEDEAGTTAIARPSGCSDIATKLPSVENAPSSAVRNQQKSSRGSGTVSLEGDSQILLNEIADPSSSKLTVVFDSIKRDDQSAFKKFSPTIIDFNMQLIAFLVNNNVTSVPLWLFHLFFVDSSDQPVLDGRTVTENELYQPLCCSGFKEISVFQFAVQMPTERNHSESSQRLPEAVGTSCRSRDLVRPPEGRTGCSGMNFYQFNIAAGIDLSKLHAAILCVLNEAATLTPKAVATKLTDLCPGLRLVQRSGLPDGQISGQLDQLDIRSPIVTPRPPPQQRQESRTATQEVANCEAFEKPPGEVDQVSVRPPELTQLQFRTPSSGPPDVAAVTLSIVEYKSDGKSRSRWEIREGGQNDNELMRKIVRNFGCLEGDIHDVRYQENTGRISWPKINSSLAEVVDKYKAMGKKDLLRVLYLFVSAHGNEQGFVTSANESVSLADLMKPLQEIAHQLILFYQPCRGKLFHSAGGEFEPELLGLSHPGSNTVGCCLPRGADNCSVIFASMPGYSSYRINSGDTTSGGSLMLASLLKVVSRPDLSGRSIHVSDLAQLVQKDLLELYPTGLEMTVDESLQKCLVQVQWSSRGNSDSVGWVNIVNNHFGPNQVSTNLPCEMPVTAVY